MTEAEEARAKLAGLTDKQREVLDRYTELMGTKEISRALGIRVVTVHQRYKLAKIKLDLDGDRNQVLQAYVRLRIEAGEVDKDSAAPEFYAKPIYDRIIYDVSTVELDTETEHNAVKVLEAGPVFTLSDAGTQKAPVPEVELPLLMKGLGALDHRTGIRGRAYAIAILAALLLLIVLLSATLGRTLNEIF